jgi:hypothetical protein
MTHQTYGEEESVSKFYISFLARKVLIQPGTSEMGE